MWVLEPALDALRWYDTRSGERGELPLEGALSLMDVPGMAQSHDMLAFVLAHGAADFRTPVSPLNRDTLAMIERCIPFYPGFNSLAYLLAGECLDLIPERGASILCETAFFSALPEETAMLGLPYAYYERGIRRYGADGLAHAWAWKRASAEKPTLQKLVSIHLGDQPGVAAILNGSAVETSAGFTEVSGIPGQFISGDLDPAIPLKLARSGWDADSISFLVTAQAGFQMVSGQNGALIDLVESEPQGLTSLMLRAALLKEIGRCLAALEGADMLLFFGVEITRWQEIVNEVKDPIGFAGIHDVCSMEGYRMDILREVEKWTTES